MDKALKQRLVGASVLIALAVIVLPMLLGGRPENPQETKSIEVPPKPSELSFETRRFPVAGQDPEQPSVVQQAAEPAVEPSTSTPADPPIATPDTQPAGQDMDSGKSTPSRTEVAQPSVNDPSPAVRSEPQETPAAPAGRYLVQVGSFSTTANANALAERLRADSLPVLMDTVESAVGILHRVRVGPFDKVTDADSALQLISSRTPDVSPRIIDLRPEEPAPVTEPSDPLVRWVVQAGSFSGQENATSLVTQLRESGFAAYSVIESGNSGSFYKVRIGPEIERQSAQAIAASLKQDLGLDGIVMSVD